MGGERGGCAGHESFDGVLGLICRIDPKERKDVDLESVRITLEGFETVVALRSDGFHLLSIQMIDRHPTFRDNISMTTARIHHLLIAICVREGKILF